MDAGFAVVSPAGWGESVQAPTSPRQPLWVEGAGKLEKPLWPALQARVPPVQGAEKGQEGGRAACQGLSPGRAPGAGLEQEDCRYAYFLDPHSEPRVLGWPLQTGSRLGMDALRAV